MEKKFDAVAVKTGCKNWEKLIEREFKPGKKDDEIRSPFAKDYTRVLHSLAYRRLKHKTQVFFNAAGNDHICTRIEHVAHVESVASTVAKELGLNDELVSAIAIAHDLGHAPFGHTGESILNKLTQDYLDKRFWHEKNGVYFVDNIELLNDHENIQRNLNLTYAVRDGIISHCGEVDVNSLKPRSDFFDLEDFGAPGEHEAVTWEGCIVKLADKISYLGRDIEDAVRLNYLSKDMIKELEDMARINNEKVLNTTVIMNNMVMDLCGNSSPETGLCLSHDMSELLNKIKEFNYKNIYKNPRLKPFSEYADLIIRQIFTVLSEFWNDYEIYKKKSLGVDNIIDYLDRIEFDKIRFVKNFAGYLAQYSESDDIALDWVKALNKQCKNKKIYGKLETKEIYIQVIIDFIAGMTDTYAINCFEELLGC